jgi:RNA polymerase sigma-70 factor (ECF subfamily)
MKITEFEWKTIVEDIGPDLYRYFLCTFSAPVASDYVQETLIRLVQKCRNDKFNSKSGTIKNYAFGIARYIRLEGIKKKVDFYLVEDESDLDVLIIDNNTGRDQVIHLRWAISQLKPIEQDLILQMIDEESTFEKIAENFKMPVGTVKSHIHRAKEKLKQIMEAKS